MANENGSSVAGVSLAGKVGFLIPKNYVEHFRAGVIFDLATDAQHRTEQYTKGYQHRIYGYPSGQRGYVGLEDEDHIGPLRYLAQSAALLVDLEDACSASAKPEQDVAVSGDPEAMMFALQALASKVAGPMLTLALDVEPGEPNEKAREWSAVAAWAMDSMEMLEPARLEVTKQRAAEETGGNA